MSHNNVHPLNLVKQICQALKVHGKGAGASVNLALMQTRHLQGMARLPENRIIIYLGRKETAILNNTIAREPRRATSG